MLCMENMSSCDNKRAKCKCVINKLTFLNRRLDLKASRIDPSTLSATDFPLSLLHCVILRLDAPKFFNCSRILEIIL